MNQIVTFLFWAAFVWASLLTLVFVVKLQRIYSRAFHLGASVRFNKGTLIALAFWWLPVLGFWYLRE